MTKLTVQSSFSIADSVVKLATQFGNITVYEKIANDVTDELTFFFCQGDEVIQVLNILADASEQGGYIAEVAFSPATKKGT